MDATLYVVTVPQFLRNYKILFKTFYINKQKTLFMLILNVIENVLAWDCVVCRVLTMTYHRFCKKYFLQKWVVLLSALYLVYGIHESYYFLCVKKTIEQIYRSRCLFIRKLFVMAYSSVQNIFFYN